MSVNRIHGFFVAQVPDGVTDTQIRTAIIGTLDSFGATHVKLYVGDDQPPPQPPIPPPL